VHTQSATYMLLGISGTSVGFYYSQVTDRLMFLIHYNSNKGR